ncbi:RNA polymerase subunit sigma-24 [Dyadobacter beijingensis]|uniref:RNA polymerase subunit sigma-24 n=1 Tax=Dyadobacter beijingensis TaxID=365489 RepID=A0ABQ2IME3_9BACT|nr:sigma-70 family RNA polymerase sigma factor [Dyadobacter beijingensis]GGN13521.1 RNA polymerase subunit sigma-24 [Dyadobacter beijingensis]
MQDLIPHLFRTEYRKIVSVLCRRFGFSEIEAAEDIASDTFLTASQSWGIEGVPPNPVGWLYQVAKNKAKNHLHRNILWQEKIAPGIRADERFQDEADIDLSAQNIIDSQLQMMFAICDPAIPAESQIALSLRILCGFGIEEIADAFQTNKDTVNKRLLRAKEKLRQVGIRIQPPEPSEVEARLEPVLTTIYLLFNEGYYSVSKNKALRRDLCLEAMRLCMMLIENPQTNQPQVNALLSLMCFHASRFDARLDDQGELVNIEAQNTDLWNSDLISKGGYFLRSSASGLALSRYHLEAAIAYWHTVKEDSSEKWENILQCYDQLLQLHYTPAAALNRTYAFSKVHGKRPAIREAEKLDLKDNHFCELLLGELYTGVDDKKAQVHFRNALMLAKTETEKQAIRKKLNDTILRCKCGCIAGCGRYRN